jgi:hypothetical protein
MSERYFYFESTQIERIWRLIIVHLYYKSVKEIKLCIVHAFPIGPGIFELFQGVPSTKCLRTVAMHGPLATKPINQLDRTKGNGKSEGFYMIKKDI